MELDIIHGSTIKNVTSEQINSTLEKVYEGGYAAAILIAENANQRFLQVAVGGHVEYREGKNKKIFAAEDVPLEKCQEMFSDYLQGGSQWKNEVDWKPQTADKKGIKTDWDALLAEARAWEDTPQYEMVKPLFRQTKMTRNRFILTVVISVILTCAFCAFSIYIYGKLEPSQVGRNAGEAVLAQVWICQAGIGWAMFHTESIVSRPILYTQLVISMLMTAGMAWLSATAMGTLSVAFFLALFCGIYVMFYIARNIRNEMVYRGSSVEVPCSHLVIHHYWKTTTSEYGVNAFPVHILGFVYLEKYKDYIEMTDKQSGEYGAALAQNKLRVFARYLPEKPKVHTTRIEVILDLKD
jgi:hypothetical protein